MLCEKACGLFPRLFACAFKGIAKGGLPYIESGEFIFY